MGSGSPGRACWDRNVGFLLRGGGRERDRIDRTTDKREGCEIAVPRWTWNTAVEGSGAGETAGCPQADSTEAVQEIMDPEVTRERAESGRQTNNPPRQPDGRPVLLPMHKRDEGAYDNPTPRDDLPIEHCGVWVALQDKMPQKNRLLLRCWTVFQ